MCRQQRSRLGKRHFEGLKKERRLLAATAGTGNSGQDNKGGRPTEHVWNVGSKGRCSAAAKPAEGAVTEGAGRGDGMDVAPRCVYAPRVRVCVCACTCMLSCPRLRF